MPSRPATKKAKKPKLPKAAPVAAPSKRKPTATHPTKSAATSLYVHASDCTLDWTSTNPKQSGATGPYGDLAAAKAAALDALLGAIERAEKLLSVVRHCDSIESLRKASVPKK